MLGLVFLSFCLFLLNPFLSHLFLIISIFFFCFSRHYMLSLFALVYYLLFFLIWALFLKYLFLDFFILFLSLPYLNLLFHIFFWKCLAYFGGFTSMSFCCAFPVILFVISYFHTKFAWGLIVIIFCSSFFHETAWAFRRRPGSATFPDFAELPFVFTLFSAISCPFLSLLSGPSFPLFLLSLSCLILIPLPAFSPRGVSRGSFVGQC